MNQPGSHNPDASNPATTACLILTVLLAAGPIVGYGLVNEERSRWHLASARLHWQQGHKEIALERIDSALQLNPENIEALLSRAEWQTELGNYDQSRLDLEQALLQASGKQATVQLRQQLCEVLYHEGDLDEIVRQWERIDASSGLGNHKGNQPQLAEILYLNNRSYQLALTGQKPDQASEDARRAIELMGGTGLVWDYNGGPLYLAACRSYLDGKEVEAALLCQQARKSSRLFFETWKMSFQPELDWKASETLQHEHLEAELTEYIARIIKLHSVLLDRIGQASRSEQAREAIRQLGHDPDSLEAVVVLASQLHQLHSEFPDLRATVLDTRGFSYLQSRQPNLARMDLEIAVKVYDTVHRQRLVQLNRHRNLAVEPSAVDREMSRSSKQLGVLLYHRSQAYEILHQPARARQDLQRIQRLGLSANRHLF